METILRNSAACLRSLLVVVGIIGGVPLQYENCLADELIVPANFSSIQAAIDAAKPGDRITVNAGTYHESLSFKGKAISLVSADGPVSTFIEAAGGTAVQIGPSGEINGFTIRKGSASFGAGMSVQGTGTQIRHNIFESNSQGAGGYGAAIGGNSASPVIEQNVFRNNSCDGQFLSGVISFVNSSSPLIANNIFVDNPCRAINLTLPSTGKSVVVNNTIVRNTAGIRVDRRIATAQQIYRNNIITDNGIGLEVDFGNEFYNPTWENNLMFNNGINYKNITNQTGRLGNIDANPLFSDPSHNDFKLLSGSPAIDAGTSAGAPARDFEGDVRPVDGNGDGIAKIDIGADEFAVGVAITIEGGVNQECATSGGSKVAVSANVFPSTLEIASITWSLDGRDAASGTVTDLFIEVGKHLLEVEVTAAAGNVYKAQSSIEIVDTTPPIVTAVFVDKKSGNIVSSAKGNGSQVVISRVNATDICDSAPSVSAVSGIVTNNGNELTVKGNKGEIRLLGSEVTLSATAKDKSGNMATTSTVLRIVE